jgi:cold shock protein
MRFRGTIKRFNKEKGFGFVSSEQHAGDAFIHISAFGRDRGPVSPQEGDEVEYDMEKANDGRSKAVRATLILESVY